MVIKNGTHRAILGIFSTDLNNNFNCMTTQNRIEKRGQNVTNFKSFLYG